MQIYLQFSEREYLRRDDGTLRPNFKPMPTNMAIDHYAFKVYLELHKGLKGLVEK